MVLTKGHLTSEYFPWDTEVRESHGIDRLLERMARQTKEAWKVYKANREQHISLLLPESESLTCHCRKLTIPEIENLLNFHCSPMRY